MMSLRKSTITVNQGQGLSIFLALTLGIVASLPSAANAAEDSNAAQKVYDRSVSGEPNEIIPTAPAMLRERTVVAGRLVRLGDLFEGTGDKRDIVVAYAPEPGKQGSFDINWLFRVARANGLDWKPLSTKQRAIVIRKSITIERAEIEDYILAALIERGVSAGMNVELSNRMQRIHVDGDSSATLAIEDILYDQRTKRFTAIIIAPADDPAPSRTRVTGRVIKMVDVPVIVRRLLKGEIIRKTDIDWIRVNSAQLQRDIIMNSAELIGKTPTRGLPTLTPVQVSDVRRPILVDKGSLVTMILKSPFMTLTAQGRAGESGSEGDVIAITNMQSNTVVHAVVTGSGRVKITPVSSMAMN